MSYSKNTKKLSEDDYIRPTSTVQEQLTVEEIAELLNGYVRISNKELYDIPLDIHLRYFIIYPDGNQQFRMGGFLKNKNNADKYIILSNGKNSWSVQVNNSVFFKKLSHKEELDKLHEYYKNKLEEKNRSIYKLKKYIKKIEK